MSHKSYLIFSSTLCAFSTDTTPTYHRTRSFTVYPRIFSNLLLLFRFLYSLSIHTPAPSLSSPDPEDFPILPYHKAEDSQTVSVGRRTPVPETRARSQVHNASSRSSLHPKALASAHSDIKKHPKYCPISQMFDSTRQVAAKSGARHVQGLSYKRSISPDPVPAISASTSSLSPPPASSSSSSGTSNRAPSLGA